jgi:hypothetical protein
VSDTADFDVHAHRHRLKQLRDDGGTELYENRDGVACPACGESFSRLFLTRRARTSFPSNDGAPFCLVRTSESICVFRH